MTDHTYEYLVVGAYLLFVLGLGFVFNKFNRNVSDYFRSGAQGTWWLVGTSLFIGAVSSATFTATAGVAFEAGWSALMVSVGSWLGILINVAFLARWFRQLRCITFPEVLRQRFGGKVEQLYALTSMLFQLVFASISLWAVATFASAVFGLNLMALLLALGIVILIYSTSGGRWAVMATDFLQGIVVLPMAILMAYLALDQIGGMAGLFDRIASEDLGKAFAPVKPYGNDLFANNTYTLGWLVAAAVMGVVQSCSLGASPRYFSCKDGGEAQKAAAWQLVLSIFGMTIFAIPPMVARFLYAPDVLGQDISKPAEAAYAIAAINLLPAGMLGLMVTAMFAASMANIDTGLNANAAIFVQNVHPLLRRLGLAKDRDDASLLTLSRWVSIAFGVAIIAIAMGLATQRQLGMFEAMLNIMGMFGLPLVIPVLLAVFIRRVPSWTPFVVIGASVIPSILKLLAAQGLVPLPVWNYQTNIALVLGSGVTAFLACMPFYERESDEYKQRVADFYRRMHTPVDFAKEVGVSRDREQARMVGSFVAAFGLLSFLLLLIPNPPSARGSVLFVSIFITTVGAGMLLYSRGGDKK